MAVCRLALQKIGFEVIGDKFAGALVFLLRVFRCNLMGSRWCKEGQCWRIDLWGTIVNAVEIEEAISALAEQPFEAAEFPFAFLQAFGNKETTYALTRVPG